MTVVRPTSRYGVVDISSTSQVEKFREKPQADGWINGGFFVFEKNIFDYLNMDSVLEGSPLINLAAEGELMAFKHLGFWQSMDTFREMTYLNDLWDKDQAEWKIW
jgi:glucose-1-phosphate cytidylyltransferase